MQAIPEVLDSLDLSGAVISIDAMGTQTNIAEQIIQSEADYILSLKGNQKHLYEDVRDCFTGQCTCHRYETLEKDHGRIEKRTDTTLLVSEVFFREDACRGRKDYSFTNLNDYKDKLFLRKRLFNVTLNIYYLKKLLKV